ncbi:MAG: TIGR03943 family putative permease subunit [Anaerovoracaceae bacterium]|jgi:hypothetical protein
MEIPVYLFTGFLSSGKTTFIQDALNGEDFNAGERTLLLLCEDGEEEYDEDAFAAPNVFIEEVEEEDDLDPDFLETLRVQHQAERVIVEYNGMWGLDTLYRNMPPEWLIYQEMTFADWTTFFIYNQNMRQQTFDKLKSAELVIFNRCVRDDTFEQKQLEAHKICRVANRKSQILYEFGPDDVIMDNIEDPLPFDKTQDLITVKDDDFAEWYRDINENMNDYDGKEIRVKGRAAVGGGLKEDNFVFGRHVMTCCVQDIQFAGLICHWTKEAAKMKNGEWVKIRAKVKVEYDPVYESVGPVLHCTRVSECPPCDPEVATF